MYGAIRNLLSKPLVIISRFETVQKHLITWRENNFFFPGMFWGRSVEQSWTERLSLRGGKQAQGREIWQGSGSVTWVWLSGHPAGLGMTSKALGDQRDSAQHRSALCCHQIGANNDQRWGTIPTNCSLHKAVLQQMAFYKITALVTVYSVITYINQFHKIW